jgi:uncharacterized protein
MPFQGNPDSLTATIISDHYHSVSAKLGYTVLPPENNVNNFGYYFMGKNLFEKAYDFFHLNITNYPKNSNVYDGMGDWYAIEKDNKKAMEYFEKALTLEDNPDTRKSLKN